MRYLLLALLLAACDSQITVDQPQSEPTLTGTYLSEESVQVDIHLDDGRIYAPRHRTGITISEMRGDSLVGVYFREATFLPSLEDFPEQEWNDFLEINWPDPQYYPDSLLGVISGNQITFNYGRTEGGRWLYAVPIECSGSIDEDSIEVHCVNERYLRYGPDGPQDAWFERGAGDNFDIRFQKEEGGDGASPEQ